MLDDIKMIQSKYPCGNCDQNTLMIKEQRDSLLLTCRGCGGIWNADAKHMKEYYGNQNEDRKDYS